MLRKKFINRDAELNYLEEEWKKNNFSLVIIYGRRRVGKTRLLKEFAKGKKSLYYLAIESTIDNINAEFSQIVKQTMGVPVSGEIPELIDFIAKTSREKVLIILDEFQYIVKADKSFTSKLQRLVDLNLKEKNIMLILCGSSVSFFKERLLGYKSPLFGRRTSSIRLHPLGFKDIKEFFPSYDIEDLAKLYGAVGGTPAYLEKLSENKNFWENIIDIITPGSYLYDEALNFLRQEVREPRTYLSILKSISEGRSTNNEIANASNIDPRTITKYLDVLEELEIIRRVKPLGKRGKSLIDFSDNYFRFWFTFIYKLRSLLEMGQISEAIEHIKENYNQYMGRVFEKIIEELVPLLYGENVVKSRPIEFGRWWHKGEEIDLIVRNPGKSTDFIEIKWKTMTTSEAQRELRKLIDKSSKTGLQSKTNNYILIVKRLSDGNPITNYDEGTILDLRALEKIIWKKE